MVISGVNTVTYNGDGITTAWPYTFPVTDDSEIRVQLNNADGTAVIVESDYYVDLINSTVYYPGYAPGSEPPEAEQPPKVQEGQTITVYREIPITQESDLGEKWPFEVIEKGLDKLTMIAQQIDSGTKRTIDNALASMELLADVVVDSGELQHITDQLNEIDDKAAAAAESEENAAASEENAAASEENAAASATSAANSDASATATATALTNFLETKETLTAPAVDPTLTISGAAADAEVTGLWVNNAKKTLTKIQRLQTLTSAQGWKITSSGSFTRDDLYETFQYPVTVGETIYICSQSGVFMFETALSGTPVGTVHTDAFDGFVSVPSGATYVAISKLKTDHASALCDVYDESQVVGENAPLGDYLTTNIVNGYYDTIGKLRDVSDFKSRVTSPIKCKEDDVFYYAGNAATSVAAALFYDENGYLIGYHTATSNGFKELTITAPANTNCAIFDSYVIASSSYLPSLSVTKLKDLYTSPLSLKKWFACGDSFTAGGYGNDDIPHKFTSGKYINKNKVYPYYIGNRTNCDVQNIAVAGMTLATKSGITASFTNTGYSSNYTMISADADIVTLWFGINDSGHSIPIGNIDDTSTTSFYGAYNTVLGYIIDNCPKAHIGIIVSNSLNQNFVDATIAVAKKWGIPYLDLNYDESVPLMSDSLRPTASSAVKAKRNAMYYISDNNHHPNNLAHEYESYFIESWLTTL